MIYCKYLPTGSNAREIILKKRAKIVLIFGILILSLALAVIGLVCNGKFASGCYFSYEINADSQTCTVTKCIPLGARNITVPETIRGYRVSEIGAYAFANRANLTDISLPEGLEMIGMGAFYECKSLQEIKIPNSVTAIGSYAFFGCEGLTSITLSANATDIGARVFEGCTSIAEASVPTWAISTLPAESIERLAINGGTHIGSYAFKGFASLTDITLSPSIESIGINAFKGCTNITSATVPAELISHIPQNKLIKLVINGGTHISERACYYFYHLTSITLPESIVSIGERAFEGCYQLAQIYNFSPLKLEIGALDNGGIARYALDIVTVPESSSKTWADNAGYLFYEDSEVCYLLGYMGEETELTLPDTCNGREYSIRAYAFYMHSDITAVTIPNGVIGMEAYAFAHCRSVESLTYPDTLISIGDYAFYECDKLSQISFGKSIASIGAFAFDECYSLTDVTFRGTVAEWQAVAKGYYWIFYTPATEVVCTDGAVDLK